MWGGGVGGGGGGWAQCSTSGSSWVCLCVCVHVCDYVCVFGWEQWKLPADKNRLLGLRIVWRVEGQPHASCFSPPTRPPSLPLVHHAINSPSRGQVSRAEEHTSFPANSTSCGAAATPTTVGYVCWDPNRCWAALELQVVLLSVRRRGRRGRRRRTGGEEEEEEESIHKTEIDW